MSRSRALLRPLLLRNPRRPPSARSLRTTAAALTRARIPIPFAAATSDAPAAAAAAPVVVEKCPQPTCPCERDPEGLDIDRQTPLRNTMASYYRHCLISTGKEDWASKIEMDLPGGDGGGEAGAGGGAMEVGGLAARIKSEAQRRGSGLRDPFAPTLITNSSFPPDPDAAKDGAGSVCIFPTGLYLPYVPASAESIRSLLRHHLLPPTSSSPPSPSSPAADIPTYPFPRAHRLKSTTILICSHRSRDSRCGLIAPVLRAQFAKVLSARGLLWDGVTGSGEGKVRVGYTSHLSGHKWAGNVVVYLPGRGGDESGWGVWYGRVGAAQVEGIVEETVVGGRVVGELCRGVVGAEGKVAVE